MSEINPQDERQSPVSDPDGENDAALIQELVCLHGGAPEPPCPLCNRMHGEPWCGCRAEMPLDPEDWCVHCRAVDRLQQLIPVLRVNSDLHKQLKLRDSQIEARVRRETLEAVKDFVQRRVATYFPVSDEYASVNLVRCDAGRPEDHHECSEWHDQDSRFVKPEDVVAYLDQQLLPRPEGPDQS